MRLLVLSTFLYACESWLLTAGLERRIQAVEMRSISLLDISYKDPIINDEVRGRIWQAIGPHKDLLTTVKRCKLQWYGHVSRTSGMAKTILQFPQYLEGGEEADRKGDGRITFQNGHWTGMQLSETLRLAEQRNEWRDLVARASVVPPLLTKSPRDGWIDR